MQIEGAQYAHLCTNMSNMHHRRSGYPFGMLVDFAADGAGFPIFCLSPLSIHSHNVRDDPRCSLVVQMPGWLGLSNARVTMFGDVFELPESMQVCWQSSLCCCSLCLQSLQSSLCWVLHCRVRRRVGAWTLCSGNAPVFRGSPFCVVSLTLLVQWPMTMQHAFSKTVKA